MGRMGQLLHIGLNFFTGSGFHSQPNLLMHLAASVTEKSVINCFMHTVMDKMVAGTVKG